LCLNLSCNQQEGFKICSGYEWNNEKIELHINNTFEGVQYNFDVHNKITHINVLCALADARPNHADPDWEEVPNRKEKKKKVVLVLILSVCVCFSIIVGG
jgi:hypothetical protein